MERRKKALCNISNDSRKGRGGTRKNESSNNRKDHHVKTNREKNIKKKLECPFFIAKKRANPPEKGQKKPEKQRYQKGLKKQSLLWRAHEEKGLTEVTAKRGFTPKTREGTAEFVPRRNK